jgi:hypothetical protein
MKFLLKLVATMLILSAACTKKQDPAPVPSPVPSPGVVSSAAGPAILPSVPTPKKNQERELQKIAKWFEQMDAVLREALWVVRRDRPPLGKSIFGKMQRALQIEMKEKLSNKSLFKCDTYSMTRSVGGLDGIPQTAEVMHRCGSKQSFEKIGDWTHADRDSLGMNFRGGNLEDVLGMTTGILSPKISCNLNSNEAGTVESFKCDGLMIDFDSKKGQVLKFDRFEYIRGAKKVLHLRAEVLENLLPIRKIEADVPMEGVIKVTETVLQAPMMESKEVPAIPAPPVPGATPAPPGLTNSKEGINAQSPQQHDQNQPILPPGAVEGQADSGEVQDAHKQIPPGLAAPPANPVGQIREVSPNQQEQDAEALRQQQEELRKQQELQKQQQPPSPPPQNGR